MQLATMAEAVAAKAARDIAAVRRHEARTDSGAVVMISAETTPFLYSHRNVLEIIRARRWSRGHYCPRCKGHRVREVNSCKVADAFNCGDCHYNFNSVSGTFFHGSKIGLHLQIRVVLAIDLLGTTVPLRKIAELTEISYKTVKLQYGRLAETIPQAGYISWPDAGPNLAVRTDRIMDLFEHQAVTIDMGRFHERLDDLLFAPVKGLELAG